VKELVVEAARPGHLINGLKVQRQVGVVDGVILGAVVDVGNLADVILLLLLVMEGLQQLAPPVEHEQQPLTATWHAPLHRLSHTGAVMQDQDNFACACLVYLYGSKTVFFLLACMAAATIFFLLVCAAKH